MSHLIAVAAIFALAGFVKGVIGLGLPTISMGLLGLVMAPAQAAALLILPSTITNLWQLAMGPGLGQLLRRLWPLFMGVVIGTLAGSGWLTGNGGGRAKMALGLALAIYAVVGLTKVRLKVPPRFEKLASPVVGLLTGLVTAATGVFVIPAVPYLQALGLDKEELIQALGLSFSISTFALAAVLWRDGAFGGSALVSGSLLALATAMAGMGLGTFLRGRVKAETFRLCFFWGLLLLGGHLALTAML